MAGNGTERRRAPRAEATFPIRLEPTGSAKPAALQNISTSGLCCHTDQAVPEMTVMAVQIELPGVGATEVQGAVVRCDPLPSGGGFELALYFTETTPQARQAIAQFVGPDGASRSASD